MKKLLFGLLLTWSFVAKAQVYNNEWIDYTKTYYKFKVSKNGLFRISQSVLSSAGLGATPAEHFQLWRNGRQVALYTSVPNGALSATDYIEFWGQMNDGKPDRELYRNPAYQLNDKWSLETDTSAYFLTVNATSANLRLQPAVNDIAGNTLPADPYFMYTTGNYFRFRVVRDTLINGQLVSDTALNIPQQDFPRPNKDVYVTKFNPGYAINVGEYLYSSSYDRGEGYSSLDITSTAGTTSNSYGTITNSFRNLYVYNAGPQAKFKISASGNAVNTRRYRVNINGDSVLGNQMDFFTYRTDSTLFAPTLLNSMMTAVTVTNIANIACYPAPTGCQVDRMVVHQYEITYPRQFNFGGASNFEFMLPPSDVGNFLQITNFSYGSATPVLYDLSNNKRYTADVASAPMLRFALPPSSLDRSFVLVSEEASNQNAVPTLQTRNFINYGTPANQGDYMIISHPSLFVGAGGSNPVNDYRLYRSSAAGGSYTAKVYLIDEITDQFGFGIKKNPAGLRNFLRYARNQYTLKPKHVFIIGRGMHYVHQRVNEMAADIDKLNIVPTFGYPASDVLLTAEPGSSQPELSIGRLSAVSPQEVSVYLKKVKEFELAQATPSPTVAGKGWMKNFVHIVGASDENLTQQLQQMLKSYEDIISDTLYGANVTTFSKTSSDAVAQLNSTRLQSLFEEGLSVITYFGHSSSTTLEFNLDNPENYNNAGKYPMFIGLGCNAGNFFNYSPVRLQTKETLSEKYVLAPDRGTIGFIASTHFGIVHYLDTWASRAYKNMAYRNYDKTVGEMMKTTAEDVFALTTQEDFYARCNTEESELHGDPAIRLNPHPKPDYVIEAPMLKVTPGFVSVADPSFRIDASFRNIGRSPNKNVVVEVRRQLPNGSTTVVHRETFAGIHYSDSLFVNIPINPTTDKGLNKIIVTVDADNTVDEAYENNNSVSKDIVIYEDEARPVYPYNFAIVNKQNIRLTASTANPFSSSKQYVMEMDTTEAFNSPLKVSRSVTSAGGTMDFTPGITFTDGTVYYWRVAPATTGNTPPAWNKSSFIYLPNSDVGFNQSHYFQQLSSNGQGISLNGARQWQYGLRYQNLFVRQGSWVTSTGQEAGLSVAINGGAGIRNTCWFQSLVFNVFDPVTFEPWVNNTPAGTPADAYRGGQYGSGTNTCVSTRRWNFEYRWDSVSSRKRALNFMKDSIPDGAYVVVRSFLLDPTSFPAYAGLIKYANDWRADEAVNGAGNTLYHALKNAGFSGIDSFYRPRQFAMIYKKNDPSFTPKWIVSDGTYDNVTLTADCPVPDTIGTITSPQFGPAKGWKTLSWRGTAMETVPGDHPVVKLVGVTQAGAVDTLMNNLPLDHDVDISGISAATYPYLKIYMSNGDHVNYTPHQLQYWRLTYSPAPEGAIAPNAFFSMTKDTFDVAEPLDFKIAFKNVSDVPFDSLKVKLVVTDRNNVQHQLPVMKHRPMTVTNPQDTVQVHYNIDTRSLVGSNSIYIEVNPDNDQPEQYHFNNFAYKSFYVRGDTLNPLLDVTFDNVHILNHDIISPKPNITIKLKDEAKWFLVNDPSRMKVQVRKLPTENDPNGWLRDYAFGTDTLQFFAAQQAPNHDNTATAIFKPYFMEDGAYELIVTGKDMSDNAAGNIEYRVAFQIINKPMISNMLNYPNPFTTSTAFVFTVTGAQVPQNLRIQILTITGKVVREITKEELGPIRIGRNITEFKWDGTDQYGQRLANGVYLYRVITNLNGKSLDKYTTKEDDTDKYFNKGYGKMYLMR